KILDKIKNIIKMYPGDSTTCLKIRINGKTPVMIKLCNEYNTCSDPDFFDEISKIAGKGCIEVRCAPIKEPVKRDKPWLKHKK
ncbi:MAG: hypothetical protein GY870_06320, partial [archaeon]|nr:hypothetical protein [archaeon]